VVEEDIFEKKLESRDQLNETLESQDDTQLAVKKEEIIQSKNDTTSTNMGVVEEGVNQVLNNDKSSVDDVATPADATDVTQPTHETPVKQTPLIIVIQWLTYAFWGWLLIAIGSLLTSTLMFFFADTDVGSFAPYAIAATLVILPMAITCDLIYSKKESLKKSGAEAVVMVIHAVIFALIGIGSLIVAVFTLVNILTNASVNSSHIVTVVSSVLIALLYAATFTRTINLHKKNIKLIPKIYLVLMIVIVSITIISSIAGPVMKTFNTRDDRLLMKGLPELATAVNVYFEKNDKLPEHLSELSIEDSDARTIVQKGLVTYKPNTKQATYKSNKYSKYGNGMIGYYQLCASYKAKSSGYSTRSMDYYYEDDYKTYLSTYSHPAGEFCYKVETF